MIYQDITIIIFLAVCSAFFSYMLDFGLGKPGAADIEDVSDKELLFFWSYFLAKRRVGERPEYSKKEIFANGRDFFTWEKAFGMCIYCTGFWIALLLFALPIVIFQPFTLTIIPNFFIILTTPIFSHFILRKI